MDVLIYGVIGDSQYYSDYENDIVYPSNIIKKLDEMPLSDNELNLRINSFGGSSFGGIAIKNYITNFKNKRQGLKVNTYIEGAAMSAATQIAFCADKVYMNSSSMLMIHNTINFVYGNKNDMKKAIEILEKFDNELVKFYSLYTGLDQEKIKAFLDAETFFTPEEALANNFIHEIIPVQTVENNYRVKYYNFKTSKQLNKKSLEELETIEQEIFLEEQCLHLCK